MKNFITAIVLGFIILFILASFIALIIELIVSKLPDNNNFKIKWRKYFTEKEHDRI